MRGSTRSAPVASLPPHPPTPGAFLLRRHPRSPLPRGPTLTTRSACWAWRGSVTEADGDGVAGASGAAGAGETHVDGSPAASAGDTHVDGSPAAAASAGAPAMARTTTALSFKAHSTRPSYQLRALARKSVSYQVPRAPLPPSPHPARALLRLTLASLLCFVFTHPSGSAAKCAQHAAACFCARSSWS